MITNVQSIGRQYRLHNAIEDLHINSVHSAISPETQSISDFFQRHQIIDSAIKGLEEIAKKFDRKLYFSINEKLNTIVIKVIDPATDTVIREIPSEITQKIQQELQTVSGLIFDKRI